MQFCNEVPPFVLKLPATDYDGYRTPFSDNFCGIETVTPRGSFRLNSMQIG